MYTVAYMSQNRNYVEFTCICGYIVQGTLSLTANISANVLKRQYTDDPRHFNRNFPGMVYNSANGTVNSGLIMVTESIYISLLNTGMSIVIIHKINL